MYNKLLIFLIFLFTTSIFPQQNMNQALKKGGWTGGLAGWVGWENFNVSETNGDLISNSKVDGYNFIFSSRNGSLVENNGVFGFDFQWRQKDRTVTPDPNPSNISEINDESIWFLGLWARYYIPLEGEFAMFIEGSGGYASFSQKYDFATTEEPDLDNSNSSANGFAYNAGVGFSLFVSPNAAFEITGRWEGGTLSGNTEYTSGSSSDLEVKLSNIFILFGFQVYLQ
jgi:opacity protein-like surface antigen